MLKIFVPIILFIIVIFGISNYWNKANVKNKKKSAIIFGLVFAALLIVIAYFVID